MTWEEEESRRDAEEYARRYVDAWKQALANGRTDRQRALHEEMRAFVRHPTFWTWLRYELQILWWHARGEPDSGRAPRLYRWRLRLWRLRRAFRTMRTRR